MTVTRVVTMDSPDASETEKDLMGVTNAKKLVYRDDITEDIIRLEK